MNNKKVHMFTFFLTVIGALNWGLVGLLDLNLVTVLLGGSSGLVQLVYVLIGASAVHQFATHKSYCQVCAETKEKKKNKE